MLLRIGRSAVRRWRMRPPPVEGVRAGPMRNGQGGSVFTPKSSAELAGVSALPPLVKAFTQLRGASRFPVQVSCTTNRTLGFQLPSNWGLDLLRCLMFYDRFTGSNSGFGSI
jgi:hypothetical protein